MDQILDPNRHAARRIIRQVIETEPPIEGAHAIIEGCVSRSRRQECWRARESFSRRQGVKSIERLIHAYPLDAYTYNFYNEAT